VFFWGTGGNGKGTLIETVLNLMGDYGTVVPMTTLIERRHSEHPTEIADLAGKRLAVASETDQRARWNAARIKVLTGSDKLKGRFMRADFFEFIPRFKLIISANNKPGFGTVDDAIRRRLVLLPFTASFTEGAADTKRKERLRDERSGILQWAIEGCLEYRRDGLGVPQKLKAATEAYLAEADDVMTFVEECCVVEKGVRWKSREAYAAWAAWCGEHGIDPGHKRPFTERMTLRFPESRPGPKNQMVFWGVRMARDGDDEGAPG
jgi:putative DNA primase/helicase